MPQVAWSSFIAAMLMGSVLIIAVGLLRRYLIQFGKGIVVKGVCLIAALRLLCFFSLPAISIFPEGVLTPYGLSPVTTLFESGFQGREMPWLSILILTMLGIWAIRTVWLLVRDLRKLFLFYRQAHYCAGEVDEEVYSVACHIAKELKIDVPIQVLQHNMVMYPAMIGFFRPAIFIPDCEWSETELRHIFTHELIHFRHGDAFFRVFFMVLQDLFWWNPLVYYLQQWVEEACEFHCDYTVTQSWTHKERVSYAYTITKAVEQSQLYKPKVNRLAVAFAQSGENVTLERFRCFMTEKKEISWRLTITSFILAVTLCILSWVVVPVESYAIVDQRVGSAYMVDMQDGSFELYIDGKFVDVVIGDRTEIEQSMPVYD